MNNPEIASKKDLCHIASMHIEASINKRKRTPRSKYHFYLEKVKLFYTFDANSIILTKNNGNITGVLIYTYDEQVFNKYAGPSHIGFYIRILKTLSGYYGFDFLKYFKTLRSSLGKADRIQKNSPDTEAYGKIWVLIVADEYRRQGIASKLLKTCIKNIKLTEIKYLRVTVKDDNRPAIDAYEKQNFEKIGTCEESSGHSYIMQLKL
ncbi:MAG: GNAT family N-acetyltransferase [Verrucomicrobiota bacterium]|nr:GNAT family N-acetyltransferase [Verrucomicrobiota bacterium]